MLLFNLIWVDGVCPDKFLLTAGVGACTDLGFLDGGRQIHGYMYRSQNESDISLKNALLDLYAKCARLATAKQLFYGMGINRNLVSWTTMIAGYMINLLDDEALLLYSEMLRSGFLPDSFACATVLCLCCSSLALWEGQQVHGHIIKLNLEFDGYVGNGLINLYTKCGNLNEARTVLSTLTGDDIVSYNAMLEGYAMHGELIKALQLFTQMRHDSLCPNILTYVPLLEVSSVHSSVILSKQIHGLMIKSRISSDLFAGSALIDINMKQSLVEDARSVFETMESHSDIVVWNAMTSGYAQNARGEEAVKLFNKLRNVPMMPNEFTFVAVLNVASGYTSTLYGSQLHGYIIKVGVNSIPHVSNALADTYAKCGCVKEAWNVFEWTREKDATCWNSMISSNEQHGHAEEALRVFQIMKEQKIAPNYVTFVGVLSACAHAGMIQEGMHHFNSMHEEFGIVPGTEHYATMVNLFGRSGKLQEAKEFVERMPVQPTSVVWRSLLASCKQAGDVKIGRYAAEMAFLADPTDAGPYVMLSSIYAANGLWDEAENLRRMDHIGSHKKAAFSY